MSLPVVSAKNVQINDGGVVRTVRLAAPNVAGSAEPRQAHRCSRVTRWSPRPPSPVVEGMQIQVTRVRIEKVTQQMPLAAE